MNEKRENILTLVLIALWVAIILVADAWLRK